MKSQTATPIPRWLPQLRDILFFAVFLAALALGPRMLNMDGDLPRHLLTGRFIAETRSIPTVEPFAYPYEGRAYVSHEWLTDLLFYWIQNSFGLAGLVLLSAALLASTFTVIYSHASQRADARLPVLLLTLFGAAVTSLNWVARPHLISMFLLALWLVWTDKLARGEKFPAWIFIATMILWSNLHGEFIAGMLVSLAYTLGWTMEFLFNRLNTDPQTGRRLWIVFLAAGIASLLNPATYHPYVTLIGFVNNDYLMSRMSEANPPDFSQPGFTILLGLIAVSILLLALNPKRLSAGQAFLLTGFTAMSLMAARNVHLYGVVAPFALAETLHSLSRLAGIRSVEATLKQIEGQARSARWMIVTVIVFSVLVLGTRVRNIYAFDSTFFPTQAVAWLEENPQQGRMFNDLNWGGYIAWKLWPEQKVFADSMADVSGEMTRAYETAITLAPGWETIFTTYDIQWVILPRDSALVRGLQTAGWELIYDNETTEIVRAPVP
ncbi:MAG: hypothetical protein HFACDABA_02300 [Anaerolineales bacterium]|nr:hypothetical protein [Anaerolineales bacterium]